ncbi:hypothetical protein Pmani_033539 [Petrolisthes manimaculis]|uniref:Fibronectin type-III domain-containing protein n=1 Tax=Petrolisthes manimaculis TaxID=1843537 RepID=A0AAE1TQ02_9EUCA|nr:hypothetical protein Pmani_033539 [Petrolisthes manimaculis]
MISLCNVVIVTTITSPPLTLVIPHLIILDVLSPPSSPEHCKIINNTAENIEVLCRAGFHGGMRQLFLAEVYDEAGSLHLNQSSQEEPQFSVESLLPGTTYTIKVSAYNDKGRSQPVVLTAATLKVAEQRVGECCPSLLFLVLKV